MGRRYVMKEFRTLRADEIECRIGQISKQGKGLSLLLFKDARCDQNILDETVGPMNWKKSYELIDGQLFCTIELWDDEKKQWIGKQDVGVESNTEAQKGRASDAQKRAAFAWGLGRELYTSPFIWVKSSDCNITNGKCYDHFSVKEIGYDDNRRINQLVVVNSSNDKTVYRLGKTNSHKEYAKSQTEEPDIDKVKKEYQLRCKKGNVGAQDVLEKAGWNAKEGRATLEHFAKANIILDEMGVPA